MIIAVQKILPVYAYTSLKQVVGSTVGMIDHCLRM